MKIAAFPGSFDPPTFGHLNIIERASKLFDTLVIVIAANTEKKYLFSVQERIRLLKELTAPYKGVSVELCETLVVEFLREKKIPLLIRGVRGQNDFSYEFDLAMINRGLNPDIETIFLPTDPQYFVLRSSVIKNLASLNGDVSSMVPQNVAEALKIKFDKTQS